MSPAGFADHFSQRAEGYAAHRPTYPRELFAWLASLCAHHDLAWDCGTGSGQAAVGLAGHFRAVLATDPSEAQLAHAMRHPRVTYRTTNEAASGLPSTSADLVAAAQAFHWFDGPAFFAEAARVSRPGAMVAIWGYGIPEVAPEIDPVIRDFHDGTVGPDWPTERAVVTGLYRSVAFPFPEVTPPPFGIERRLDLEGFLGYVETWSAVSRHRTRTGRDPMPDLRERLGAVWGAERVVRWTVGLRVGRLP